MTFSRTPEDRDVGLRFANPTYIADAALTEGSRLSRRDETELAIIIRKEERDSV
jgi:hypothetical protein